MKTKIPEDFKPVEFTPLTTGDRSDMMLWVPVEGGMKKYVEATAEEVHSWVRQLWAETPFGEESTEVMTLAAPKAFVIEAALQWAVAIRNNLFGGQEYWESLPEWQRMSNLSKKKETE